MYRNIRKNLVLSSSYMRKEIIVIPQSVNITVQNNCVSVTGTLGMLVCKLHALITIQMNDMGSVFLYAKNASSVNKAILGTTTALIRGMIIGVTIGFSKKLQLIGIGYRAFIADGIINLIVGLSHSVNYKLPMAVNAVCVNQTEIVLTSINKQLIGQVAADLRLLRPPEPFKGKGIRYMDEIIRNKDTKKR